MDGLKTIEERKKRLAAVRHKWYVENKEKHHELVKSWRAKNKEKSLQISRSGYKRNSEKRKFEAREYRLKNPDAYKASMAKWSKSNPAKVCVINAKKRASKLKAMVSWADEREIEKIYEMAHRRTKETNERWEVDHIVPVQSKLVCGLHNEFNLQLLRKSDNIRKHNRYWPDMP